MRSIAALLLVLALPALAHAQALDPTLKRIRDSKTVTIGYRTDALPFSYAGDTKQPAGYSVELCKRIVASMEKELKVQPLAVRWVATTSQNRLELVQKRQIDMECGATTATLSRMELVDFSSPIFVDTTGLLVRKAAGAASLGAMGGKKIAVIAGTTNQKAVENALKREKLTATMVVMKNRDAAIAALEAGSVDAFAGDKVLLLGIAKKLKEPGQYVLLEDNLGFEPYAIALPYGESGMRLAVNRALARIYDSGAIVDIFRATLGSNAEPSPVLLIMYGIAAFPE